MSKHTPGPWTWKRDEKQEYVPATTLEGPSVLCRYWETIGGRPIEVNQRTLADARLIAAAPDLLAALKKVKRILESRAFRAVEDSARIHGVEYKGEEFTQPDMGNAIRKAEGETNE